MSEAASSSGRPRTETLPDLRPGTQAIVDTPPMATAIDRLPPRALSNLLVVAVGRDPTAVEAAIEDAGGDPENVGVVPVSATPVDAEARLWQAPRVRPSDLTGISIGIARGMRYVRPGEGWLLVEDLGVLLMHAEETRVYQLLSTLSAKCRSRDVRGVYSLSRATVEAETYERFKGLFDVDVELE